MRRPRLARVGIIAALLMGWPSFGATPEENVESVALTWLAAVDAGDYAVSWKTASDYFRGHISQPDWSAAVASVRGSLGSLKSRHLVSAKFTRSLPGAPEGEYVVIQFASSFDGKAEAIETVTPMKDPDGHWHVSGYYIK